MTENSKTYTSVIDTEVYDNGMILATVKNTIDKVEGRK